MSAIIPIFISPDRQQWIIALASEASVCYVCSSTKLRNAINRGFQEEGITDSEALHYKEVAGAMLLMGADYSLHNFSFDCRSGSQNPTICLLK